MLVLALSVQYRCGIHRWDTCTRAYQKYIGCKFGSGAEYSMERQRTFCENFRYLRENCSS